MGVDGSMEFRRIIYAVGNIFEIPHTLAHHVQYHFITYSIYLASIIRAIKKRVSLA